MTKKILVLLLAAVLMMSSLVGCGGSSDEAGSDTIKIGVSGPTTGNSAESGKNVNTGIQMAIDDVNKAGGITIDGAKKKVEAVYYDTGSNAQTGLSNCEKLVTSDKVDFLFCETFNSAVGVATMELAKKYKIPMATLEPVSSAITDKIVKDPESYKYFFKFGWDSSAYGEVCASTILDLIKQGKLQAPNKTIAICGDETDYGRSNLAAVVDKMKTEGYNVVSENYWQFGATDLYSIISDIKNSKADVIFSCSTTVATGVALIKQLDENGLGSVPHMAIYYPMQPQFTSQIGSAADGLMWAPMLIDVENNPKAKEFAQKLKDYKGEDVTFDYIDGYSDMMVVLQAMEACGSVDPEKLSAALMADKGFDGYKGLIKFNPDTHTIYYGEGYVPVNAAQIQDSKSYVIYPKSVATREFQPIQ
ncbi:MAG: ABC transporter substrate-binding protein [Syntrophomonadaceae bacterium]|nr:ABC transporter substrate-binding protein [Syntrophomonadaceae bacterium]